MLVGVFLVIIFFCLILDVARLGWQNTIVSSFWVFSVFYVLSYPVKYLIIINGYDYQAPTQPSDFSLSAALVISALFWLLIFFFKTFLSTPRWETTRQVQSDYIEEKPWPVLPKALLLLMIFLSASVYYELYQTSGALFSMAFQGNAQNEARVGSGHYFILYSLYFKAFVIAIFSHKKVGKTFFLILFAVTAILALLNTTLLGTRRPLFLLGYVVLLIWVIWQGSKRSYFFLGVYPILLAMLSSVGQVLRYSLESVLSGHIPVLLASTDYFVVSLGSAFEGIEHLANYLDKVSVWSLIIGVDQGLSWFFNMGLSLIPRGIWESKPYLYGNVAQQAYVYPEMYVTGYAQATFPQGIIVDALFGLGVAGLFLFAILTAKLFSYIDRSLFLHIHRSRFDLLIAAFLYIYLFNLVRGGTAMIMGIILIYFYAFFIDIVSRVRLRAGKRRYG